MDDKLQALNSLEAQINADMNLKPDLKTNLLKLIGEVKKSPTDDNLEALAISLEAIADSEDYKAALSAVAAVTARMQS